MARKPPKLKVEISPRALNAIDEIWEWNARRYDAEHAENYVNFLKKQARGLATTYVTAKTVSTAAELQYITIRRNPRGHGHVAIFEIVDNKVTVLNFYHTSQDWQGKLARGEW